MKPLRSVAKLLEVCLWLRFWRRCPPQFHLCPLLPSLLQHEEGFLMLPSHTTILLLLSHSDGLNPWSTKEEGLCLELGQSHWSALSLVFPVTPRCAGCYPTLFWQFSVFNHQARGLQSRSQTRPSFLILPEPLVPFPCKTYVPLFPFLQQWSMSNFCLVYNT